MKKIRIQIGGYIVVNEKDLNGIDHSDSATLAKVLKENGLEVSGESIIENGPHCITSFEVEKPIVLTFFREGELKEN